VTRTSRNREDGGCWFCTEYDRLHRAAGRGGRGFTGLMMNLYIIRDDTEEGLTMDYDGAPLPVLPRGDRGGLYQDHGEPPTMADGGRCEEDGAHPFLAEARAAAL